MLSSPGYDATGASNVNPPACVPDTAPIVTTTTSIRDVMLDMRHRAVVADVHIDVPQAPSATAEVAVKSALPKLSPLTVTDSAPECTRFMPAYDTTGPSNVKPCTCVPATAPKVICTASDEMLLKLPTRQPTDV
jgi:hypothetical protein